MKKHTEEVYIVERKNLVVVKIGTSLLTNEDGRLKIAFLGRVCEEVAEIKKRGWSIAMVTSGAMASGAGILKNTPHDIVERSVFACVGQPLLMEYYRNFFGISGLIVAQALLTRREFRDREASSLTRRTMTKLIESGIVPIVNENDLTATEELSFGDNDRLAADLAVLLGARKLVILSDVDGLYDKNPQHHSDARRIERVARITPVVESYVGEKTSVNSLGGMWSKLRAAEFAASNGVETIIVSGIPERNTLPRVVLSGEFLGTTFEAHK